MVVGLLPGAAETKVRPGVVVASELYLAERPDVLVGILTTKPPSHAGTTDYRLRDWQSAGLRAPSFFRAYLLTIYRSNVTVIGIDLTLAVEVGSSFVDFLKKLAKST